MHLFPLLNIHCATTVKSFRLFDVGKNSHFFGANVYFVSYHTHCPIPKTMFHRFQLRIMTGPVGIRLNFILTGAHLNITIYAIANPKMQETSLERPKRAKYFENAKAHYCKNFHQIHRAKNTRN